MAKPVSLSLVFLVLLFQSSSFATSILGDRHLELSRSSFPSIHAEKLIRELNLFPKEDLNVIDASQASPEGQRIVEKRLRFPNLVGSGGVSIDDLGHHAGYYKLSHSHDAR